MSVSFAGHELHSPRFALEDARQVARERFGIEGAVSELGSHQDQNVLVDTGSARFVLKIANAAFGEAELDLQNRAMAHLAERLSFEVPLPCAALDGSELAAVERGGVTYLLRLVTFIEGEPLIDAEHLAPPVLRSLGAVAGKVARSLEDFEHAAADRAMQWDPRHVGAVVEALAPTWRIPAGASSSQGWRVRRPRPSSGCAAPAEPDRALRRDGLERRRPEGSRRAADAVRSDRLRRRHAHAARVRARGRRRDAYGHDLDDPMRPPPRSCAASTQPARSRTPSWRPSRI